MPFRRISGPEKICRSPQHEPPMHILLDQGCVYEWTCPACGEIRIIGTPSICWKSDEDDRWIKRPIETPVYRYDRGIREEKAWMYDDLCK